MQFVRDVSGALLGLLMMVGAAGCGDAAVESAEPTAATEAGAPTTDAGGVEGVPDADGGPDAGATIDAGDGGATPVEYLFQPLDWQTTSWLTPASLELRKPQAGTDTLQLVYVLENVNQPPSVVTTQATSTVDRVVQFSWHWESERTYYDTAAKQLMFLKAFADGPDGRTTLDVYGADPRAPLSASGTASLTLRAGYTFGFTAFDNSAGTISSTVTLSSLASAPDYQVTATIGAGGALSAAGATVVAGATPTFTVTPPTGATLPVVPGGTCPTGSWSGSRYTTGPIRVDCTVDFTATGVASPVAPVEPRTPPLLQHPNQAPTLTLGPDLLFHTDPRLYNGLHWAEISAGAADEAAQTVVAELAVQSTTGTLAFETPPTLDAATGNLFFEATRGTYGSATVLATVRDNGGVAGGGTDTTTGTFTIRVNTPPMAMDLSIKNVWRAPCVPVTVVAYDPDADNVYATLLTSPRFGHLDLSNNSELLEVAPGRFAGAACYVPFVATFTGFDTFTYYARDSHGGTGARAVASIEIYER